jgi:hypothetical protein
MVLFQSGPNDLNAPSGPNAAVETVALSSAQAPDGTLQKLRTYL